MENLTEQLYTFATSYGIKIIGAILILIIGRIAAGIGRRFVGKMLLRLKTDPSIISFVKSLVYVLVIVFAVVAALSKFGVETTSFVAILGAAGFAIGFAMQGSLSSFASGVLVLVFKPFRVGDFIDAAGTMGTVKEIRLFNTVLASPDNIKVIVPNNKIYGDVIKNITGYDTRRVDMVFGIGYGSSVPKAAEILMRIMKEDERVLQEPAPMVAVAELADSSVNFVARPWVKKEDYWGVKFDVTEKVKAEFDAAGIEIPFPQHSIHMVGGETSS
jgi:small conductance mechanosensitive channel